jgi:TAG lipase / steryl ester hydrolase / phospholipase A2 / LPA acyltransferase
MRAKVGLATYCRSDLCWRSKKSDEGHSIGFAGIAHPCGQKVPKPALLWLMATFRVDFVDFSHCIRGLNCCYCALASGSVVIWKDVGVRILALPVTLPWTSSVGPFPWNKGGNKVIKTRRLKELEKQMNETASYEEWSELAREHDELTGQARWRQREHTSQYDYSQIRVRLDRLRVLRARHDNHGLLFTLNEGIHGNMGGMGRSALYRQAKFGTKRLIEDYIDEIDDALRFLADLDDASIDPQEKMDFFYRANVCYGRTALMLSGGGALGFYHLGVVKTLLEHELLPKVISGSSAGSLVAGVLATHDDGELEKFYDPAHLRFEAREEANLFSKVLLSSNTMIDVTDLEKLIARFIPEMTFQEAYEKTGRQVSITIAPAEPHQTSRLLNAITSPNVYIRSAVMASCAVPGVFPPVMLMAKNAHDEPQPYLPNRKWVDGSIADDLPAKRLQRLYGTNHFIVSMVNPLAIPFLKRDGERGPVQSALSSMGIGVGRELLNLYRTVIQKRNETWPRFNMLVGTIHTLLDQEYSGDINIVPKFSFYNPAKILSHLSEEDLLDLIEAGERSTYPEMEAIRTCTRISRTMEEILHRFEHGDLRLEGPEFSRPRTGRRRPATTRADRGKPAQKKCARQVAKKAPKQKAGKKRPVKGKRASSKASATASEKSDRAA